VRIEVIATNGQTGACADAIVRSSELQARFGDGKVGSHPVDAIIIRAGPASWITTPLRATQGSFMSDESLRVRVRRAYAG